MEPAVSVSIVDEVSVQDIKKQKRGPSKHYVFIINVRWQDSAVISVYRSYTSVLKLQDKLMRIRDFLSNTKDARGRTKTGALLRGESFFARFTLRKKKQAQRRLTQVDGFLKSVVQSPAYISQSDPVINFFQPLDEDLKSPESTARRINSNEDQEIFNSPDDVRSSNPELLEQYVATSNYTKKEEKDLDLQVGDIVDVIERNDHGWWFVDLEGALGWVPASLLKPRDGRADDVVMETFPEGEEETYVAVETYQAKEQGEMGLSVGSLVDVMQKNVDGWWYIRFQGEEGWAPAMFLEEVHTSSGVRRQTSIRRMNRGGLRNSISRVAGRRNTKEPPPKRQRTQLKEVDPRQCARVGADEWTNLTVTRDASLEQLELRHEPQVDRHTSESHQHVESTDECADVDPEQNKERNRREKSAGIDGHVMFERQNDFSEVTCSEERDSPRAPEEPKPANTSSNAIPDPPPLSFSCDLSNPEIQSDGSVSEHCPESGDECSDQEVFLEGSVLTDEHEAYLHCAHVQRECNARSADQNVHWEFGSHQKVTEYNAKTSQAEELEEFSEDSWIVQHGASADREIVGGMSDIVANPVGIKAVVPSATRSSITQETLFKSPNTGLQLTDEKSELGTSFETCRLQVQESRDANKQEGLRRADMDRAVVSQARDLVKGPSLAVAEDVDDLDDFMD